MKIELFDLDVPYEVRTDINVDAETILRICPNSAKQDERDDSYDICLDKDGVDELIRVLNFIKNEL